MILTVNRVTSMSVIPFTCARCGYQGRSAGWFMTCPRCWIPMLGGSPETWWADLMRKKGPGR